MRLRNQEITITTLDWIATGSIKTSMLVNKEYVLLIYHKEKAYENDLLRYRWLRDRRRKTETRIALPLAENEEMVWTKDEIRWIKEKLEINSSCLSLMGVFLFPFVGFDMLFMDSRDPTPNLLHLLTTIKSLHDENIYHFDIKPDNILVMGDEIQLIDVGCTASFSKNPRWTFSFSYPVSFQDVLRFWKQTGWVGTLLYMAPERMYPDKIFSIMMNKNTNTVWHSNRGAIRALDYWSLGITLFHMVYPDEFTEWRQKHPEISFSAHEDVVQRVHRLADKKKDPWKSILCHLLCLDPLERKLLF